MPKTTRKPPWLKIGMGVDENFRQVRKSLDCGGLHTVCEEAHCPNQSECWKSGTATFMILGDTCTRGCRFCAVKRGNPGGVLAENEPAKLARAAKAMGLKYVVVTSVTRDDLADGGAAVFAETVRRLKELDNPPLIELLIPDLLGDSLKTVLAAGPDVLAHNLEVVEEISPAVRHQRFAYRNSLKVLAQAKEIWPDIITKSSIMLGLGETFSQIERTMDDMLEAGVDILVMGQYLQPSKEHAPVEEYVHPNEFDRLAEVARGKGFGFVASGPLVRTSYMAAEAYVEHLKNTKDKG